MERFDAREIVEQRVTWRVAAVWVALQAAGRLQLERGRPVGALGATLDVALNRMLMPAMMLAVTAIVVWVVIQRA